MAMNLLQEGEEARSPTVLNRPHIQALEQSGFAPDGSDFDGYAKRTDLDAAETVASGEAAARIAGDAATLADAVATAGVNTAAITTPLTTRVSAVEAGQSSALVGYSTRAALFADLAHPAGTVGYVTADTTPANNGYYLKSGASGAGAWTQSSFDRVALVEGRATVLEATDVSLTATLPDAPLTEKMVQAVSGREGAAVYQPSRGGLTVPLSPDTMLQLLERMAGGLPLSFGTPRGQLYDSNMVVVLGQSNGGFAQAPSGGDMDAYLTNPTKYQRYGNLKPTAGFFADDPQDFTLIPMVPDTTTGFWPIIGISDYGARLLKRANGWPGRFIGSNANLGGAALENIMPGGVQAATTFWRACRQVAALKVKAAAAFPGATFGVPFAPLIHGESGTNAGGKAAYVTGLQTMWQHINGLLGAVPPAATPASLKAASGQTTNIPLYISQIQVGSNQVSAFDVKRAQYEAARDNANIRLVGPTYWLGYWDNQHYHAWGAHLLGQMFARAYAYEVATGLKWVPVSPIEPSLTHGGGTITVRINRPFNARLIFDTVTIRDPGSYGFEVYTSGLVKLTITSVALVDGDQLVITYSGGTGAWLRYALHNFVGFGGPRSPTAVGNLRTDTLGGALSTVRGFKGDIMDMQDWCVAFELALP